MSSFIDVYLDPRGQLEEESKSALSAAPDDADIRVTMALAHLDSGRMADSLEPSIPSLRRFSSFDFLSLNVKSWAGLEGLAPNARRLLLSQGGRTARRIWPGFVEHANNLEVLLLQPGWGATGAQLEKFHLKKFGLRKSVLDSDAFLADVTAVDLWRVRFDIRSVNLPKVEAAEMHLSPSGHPAEIVAPRMRNLELWGSSGIDKFPSICSESLHELWIQDFPKVEHIDLSRCPRLKRLSLGGLSRLRPEGLTGIPRVSRARAVIGSEKKSRDFVAALGVDDWLDGPSPLSEIDYLGFWGEM